MEKIEKIPTNKAQLKELARLRREQCPQGYRLPEEFPEWEESSKRYKFECFVSPINKACINLEDVKIMGVLQDWSGADHLNHQGFIQKIQDNGYDPDVRTNQNLCWLFKEVMGVEFNTVYLTNAVPWIKAGNISAKLFGWRRAKPHACALLLGQFEIFNPELVLAFGWQAGRAVKQSNIPSDKIIYLRHPSRRGIKHLQAEWHKKIIASGRRHS